MLLFTHRNVEIATFKYRQVIEYRRSFVKIYINIYNKRRLVIFTVSKVVVLICFLCEGFMYAQSTIGDGVRQSSAECYLRPAQSRPNLHIAIRCHVTKVEIVYSIQKHLRK